MNKALNSVLFVIAATIFLSIVILAVFFALVIPLSALMSAIGVGQDESIKALFLGVVFILSLLGGLFIYNFTLKLVIKKFDIEKYLVQRKPKSGKPGGEGT